MKLRNDASRNVNCLSNKSTILQVHLTAKGVNRISINITKPNPNYDGVSI